MLFEDNEPPRNCVSNLLHTIRGEVPLSRLQGIDKRVIDAPFNEAGAELMEQARQVVEAYEPRFTIETITLSGVQSAETAAEKVIITGKETG